MLTVRARMLVAFLVAIFGFAIVNHGRALSNERQKIDLLMQRLLIAVNVSHRRLNLRMPSEIFEINREHKAAAARDGGMARRMEIEEAILCLIFNLCGCQILPQHLRCIPIAPRPLRVR